MRWQQFARSFICCMYLRYLIFFSKKIKNFGKTQMINISRALAIGFLFLGSFSFADKPNTVVATIPVGDTPAGLAVTPNNLFAYVANNNNDGIPGGDTVSVLNLKNNTVEQTISDSSFNQPYTVTINAAGTKAYVTNSNSTTVTVIDIATNTVTGTIGGFDGPSGMAIAPN